MDRLPLTIAESLHLIPSVSALDRAAPRIWCLDSVWIGPCSPDPVRHGALRREEFERLEAAIAADAPKDRRTSRLRREGRKNLDQDVLTADDLRQRLEAFSPLLPIVVWTTSAWTDRLFLWWVCDALRRAEVDLDRVYVAEPSLSEDDPHRASECLGIFNEPELAEASALAQPLTRELRDASADLWLAFAGPDPTAFDRLRRLPSAALPRSCEPFRYGFPRRDPDGTLRLSELDQRLLGFLREDEWRRPIDLLIAASPDEPLLFPYRERFVGYRLQRWRERKSEEPYLISEPRPDGVNSFTRVAYRLSEGAKALADGIDSLSQAPPMEIGGCVAYVDPYVVEEDDGDWRIARL
ncbi:MAG TPA: hypothetical protein VGN57_07290 [Pirellulaceae bacterium]|jgi:hypothetical protein|nr:hypothetical protein [Pirellulaceae bacterium]